MNDKVKVREILEMYGIPVPKGVVCDSFNDLLVFFRKWSSPRGIIVKQGHWKVYIVKSENEVMGLKKDLTFPIVAEIFYPVVSSPVCHTLGWKNHYSHLFILNQRVNSELQYQGNSTPLQAPKPLQERIKKISLQVLELFFGYSGICGIDYIITPDNNIFVVDINPRFNSSTYPYYFLTRMQVNFEETYTSYGSLQCQVGSLGQLLKTLTDLSFTKKTKEGIFLFAPLRNRISGLIEQVSYLCVSKDQRQLNSILKSSARVLRSTINYK